MSNRTRAIRRPRRRLPPAARTAAAVVAATGLTLSLAAFAASPSPAVAGAQPNSRPPALSGSTNTQKALAFSRCMRSHGVPKFPDPTSSGVIPKVSPQELGVSSVQLQAAEQACQRLLPPGTDDQYPPGEVRPILAGMLRFSQCMRSHGVPDWPDPATDSEGRPIFPLSRAGISRQESKSPRVTHAAGECQHLLPPALPGIPIG